MPDNIDVIITIIIVLMGAETRFITNEAERTHMSFKFRIPLTLTNPGTDSATSAN